MAEELKERIERLIRQLNSVSWQTAQYELIRIGEPAVDALIGALGDESGNVRLMATWVLGEIGDATAIPALIKALKSENRRVRRRAALMLGEFGEPALVAFNESYLKGDVHCEIAERFYDALGKKLGEDFEKGTIASPREKPKDLKDPEMKRLILKRSSKSSKRKTPQYRRILASC